MNQTAPEDRSGRRVLMFVKSPDDVSVKKRLAKTLGDDTACRLYRCFTRDVLETLDRTGFPLAICHYPPDAGPGVARWLGGDRDYLPQIGRDLGERMADAFARTFAAGWRAAVLIGTDFPDLPADFIDAAFRELPRCGAVIGPATDGGYYLIGFQAASFDRGVFHKMPWGTSAVFQNTLGAFHRLQYRPHVLPQWRDIDDYADLKAFMADHAKDRSQARHTLDELIRNGLLSADDDEQKAMKSL